MCTVRSLELVNQTSIQLNKAVVSIVLQAIVSEVAAYNISPVIQAIDDCRLYIELPSLVCTKVECKIQSQLVCQVVVISCLFVVSVITKEVTPTKTSNSNNFKWTRLAFVTTKPVAQVNST